MRRPGIAALFVGLLALCLPASATAAFDFLPGDEGFSASILAPGGAPATQAGSHPERLRLQAGFDKLPSGYPDGDLRDLEIELPAGMILNPTVVASCAPLAFSRPRFSPHEASESGESCPDRSQVGTIEVESKTAGEERRFGLFNLTPPTGVAARVGASPFGAPIVFDLILRDGPNGYVTALRARNAPQAIDVGGIQLDIWGVPWHASHDGERGDCLKEPDPSSPWGTCSVGSPSTFKPLAYLTMPARCGQALSFVATASSWQGGQVQRTALHRDGGGNPVALGGCSALHFAPIPVAKLIDKSASSASGFFFSLVTLATDNATLTDPNQPVATQMRRAVVRLPDGVTVNPSVGAGLGTCSPGQLAAETAFSAPGAGCPNASRIGSIRLKSPLFSAALSGGVHLATPHDNPFGSLLSIYLVARSAERGTIVKLAGQIVPDPATGRLTATFDNLPQSPYTSLELELPTGQRGFLVTPPSCGGAVSEIRLSPWTGLADFQTITTSPIETGAGGAPCPPPGAPPFAPRAVAGAVNSNVGSYTPYFVRLSRSDTEQEITSYSLVLPKGITGKLAGIPFCPEAAIAAARTRSGVAEAASPSCPVASQVGRTVSGYGVGSAQAYADGRVFLAGPYNGAPLSLVTVNSANVGPFDLGTIVVRSAFQVDKRTAQLRIDSRASDPIPHILQGIPLHLREVRVYMDRHQFTHNPSSCEPSELVSTLTGSGARFEDRGDDSVATTTSHFQMLNCRTLGFRPKLGLRLRGGSKRGDYPSLRATFASRGERDSNLDSIAVATPQSLFLAQNHIKDVCTRVQFNADRCPASSVYGKAVAYTPLFDEPLRGEVYLRSSDHRLPDLVTLLRAGAIRIAIEGKIGPSKKGGILAQFSELPDAPIERFTMTLYGGKRGLLTNSVNICRQPPLASVKALGQNNLGAIFTTELRGQCGRKKKKGGAGKATASREIVQEGTLRLTVDGSFAPKRLPRKGVAPISVSVGGEVSTTDGTRPPQLEGMRIELNRQGVLQTVGLPTCPYKAIQPGSSRRALTACRAALVGRGTFAADITLSGQEPYPAKGRLLMFNARKGGKPVLFGHIYSARPFASSFVIVFEIDRIRKGRYGLALTADLPQTLGSWGNLTAIEMTLGRRYSYRGRSRTFISAGCPAPKGFSAIPVFTLARTSFSFAEARELTSVLTGDCRVRD